MRVEALCDAVSKEHDFDTQIAINALVPFYDDAHSASALLSTFAQQLRRLPNAERIRDRDKCGTHERLASPLEFAG